MSDPGWRCVKEFREIDLPGFDVGSYVVLRLA